MRTLHAVLIFTILVNTPAWAGGSQSHAQLREAVLSFIQKQTLALPGKIDIKVEDIDRRTSLPACSSLEAFLPNGAQLLGKTSIGVRCKEEKNNWAIFVQAQIKVSVPLLIANRPLAQGSILGNDDFRLEEGQLGQPGLLTTPSQAIGKTLKFSIGAGQVLRQDMLRAPFVVTQGQTAEVRVRGSGFAIRSSGQALNNGAEGQNVQIRMPSGQVVTGIAGADGVVEIRP